MIEQFFGKTYRNALLFLAGTFALSAGVFWLGDTANLITLVVIGLAAAFVSFKRLELGIFAAFLELFSNSHGHQIFAVVEGFQLSLRMAIFGGVLLGWFIGVFAKKHRMQTTWIKPFLPLMFAVVIGVVLGAMNNALGNVFSDGNAYLYLLYLLPISSVVWDTSKKRQLLQVLAAAATWVMFVTVILLYLFTHFHPETLRSTYVFLRDIRLAEITNIQSFLFRIFIQSQFFVIVFSALLLSVLLTKRTKKEWWVITAGLSGAIATILIGFSRSFWVGIIAALVVFAAALFTVKPRGKEVKKLVSSILLASVFAVLIFIMAALFPLPSGMVGGNLTDFFSSRSAGTDAGISSRWNLLTPMIEDVKTSPLLGYGFGHEVTFITDDPRVRAINPNGEWTTFSLEWGWLELWLKMGILGPISFIYLFVFFVKGLLPELRTKRYWLALALMCSLAFMFVTHVFSPYLNHPIGLGFLLFLLPFLSKSTQKETVKELKKKTTIQKTQPAGAVLSKS